MPGSGPDPKDVLVSPLADLIRETGVAVAEAHGALGAANLELVRNTPDELKVLGWTPAWFELAEVEAEISLAFHVEESQASESGGKRRWRLLAAPHNAKYQNAFKYSAEGRSKVTVKFAAAPPPTALQPDTED